MQSVTEINQDSLHVQVKGKKSRYVDYLSLQSHVSFNTICVKQGYICFSSHHTGLDLSEKKKLKRNQLPVFCYCSDAALFQSPNLCKHAAAVVVVFVWDLRPIAGLESYQHGEV
jgi:hypothetical protein